MVADDDSVALACASMDLVDLPVALAVPVNSAMDTLVCDAVVLDHIEL